MTFIFNEVLYRPIFNILIVLYNVIPGGDFGLAIVVLTILFRLAFMPLSVKSLKSQRALSKLQPKIKELQEKYKNDKAAQAQAVMALYKEYNVNPVSGCLPLLIQIPVLIALYRAFARGFQPQSLDLLYRFVTNPGVIKNISFGFLDLSRQSPWLAILSGVFQFVHSKISLSNMPGASSKNQSSALDPSMMNRQMLYFFPIMIIIIGWKLPAGLVLYWAVATLFSVFEQFYVNKLVK